MKAELETFPLCVHFCHMNHLHPDGPGSLSQGHRAALKKTDGGYLAGAAWAMTGGQARMTGQPRS